MAKLTNQGGRPSTGVVSYAVMAVVVDNVDPDARGRVKVKYPTLAGEPTSHWLRQVTPAGGESFGFYSLPEVGDEVLVVFLQGDQNHGIIVGSLWNGSTVPPAEAESPPSPADTEVSGTQSSTATFTEGNGGRDSNDRRFWRSRSGSMLAFDDSSGSESVQLWNNTRTLSITLDTASDALIVSNTAGDTHIRTSGDLYLEAAGKIIMQSGDDLEATIGADASVTVGANTELTTGQSLAVTAGTDASVEAGTSMKLTAGTTMDVKGTTATFEGSGKVALKGGMMAEISAGMVKIN